MSWGVAAIGKAPAVRAAIAEQFAKAGKCAEPEEGVRQAAAAMIDTALAAQDPASAVKVSASGSQMVIGYQRENAVVNQLSIAIEPQWGFVE